jgi:hypothetical protein
VAKYADRLPLYRQEAIYARDGGRAAVIYFASLFVLSQIAGRPDGSEEGYRPAQEVFSQSHGSVWTMTPELRTEADAESTA